VGPFFKPGPVARGGEPGFGTKITIGPGSGAGGGGGALGALPSGSTANWWEEETTTPRGSNGYFVEAFNAGRLLAPWVVRAGSPFVVAGSFELIPGAGNPGGLIELASTVVADASASVRYVVHPTDTGRMSPTLRGTWAGSLWSGYWAQAGLEQVSIVSYVAGVPTLLNSALHAWASGDVLELRAVGTLLQVRINGALALSATDSTHAQGRPGIAATTEGAVLDRFTYQRV
jgi:hypothetical protein